MRTAAFALALALAIPAAAARAEEPAAPVGLEALMRRQDEQIGRGEAAAAVAEARERLARDGNDPEARYLVGRALALSGDRDGARAQFGAALDIDPRYAPGWRGMAGIHILAKDYEAAVRDARKAWEYGGDGESLRVLVTALYRKGDRAAAHALLAEELGRRPGQTDLRLLFAGILFEDGNLQEAEREARQVVAAVPEGVEGRQILVMVLYRTGQKAAAIAECRELLRRSPKDVQFLVLLRDLLVEQREFSDAAAVMEQLLACELPDDLRARAVENLKQLRLAAAAPKEGTPIDRKELPEMLKDEDPEKRREAMRVIVDQGLVFTHEGTLLRLLSDKDETVRLYAIRLVGRSGRPEHAWILDLLLFHPDDKEDSEHMAARAAEALGDLGGAEGLPVLFRCVALRPEEPVLRASLGSIRKITGRSFLEDHDAAIPEAAREGVKAEAARWWAEHPTGRHWKRKAAAAIGGMKQGALMRYVVFWVADDDAATRAAALDALASFTGDPKWRDAPTETIEQRTAVLERAAALMKE